MLTPRRRSLERGPLIVLLTGLLAWSAVVLYKRHETAQTLSRLEQQEFARIQPLPGSLLIKHESTHGTETARVQSSYKTSLTFSKVKAHYTSELVKQGWVVRDEHFLPHSGSWQNVDEVLFCKESFQASLDFSDNVPQSSYWFDMSWGLSDCE